MSKKAAIDTVRCDKSPFCPVKRVCPQGAISQQKGEKKLLFFNTGNYQVDKSKCTGCGICVSYCPHGAVKMQKI